MGQMMHQTQKPNRQDLIFSICISTSPLIHMLHKEGAIGTYENKRRDRREVVSAIITSKIKMEITQPIWCRELPTTNVAVSFAKASIADPG